MKWFLFLFILTGTNAFAQTPRMHFNHCFVVIDSVSMNAIRNSDFINNEFGPFITRTTKADHGNSWTGSYIYGHDSYVELFQVSASDSTGDAGIGFSVDGKGEIETLNTILKANYKTELGQREKEIDGAMIPWFHLLAIDDSVYYSRYRFNWWIMEYNQEYFDRKGLSYSHGQFRRDDYLKPLDSLRSGKILKDFTAITLKLKQGERELFTGFLRSCGYTNNGKDDFISPDGFVFHIRARNASDLYSVSSLEFDMNQILRSEVRLSEHVRLILSGNKGHIDFN